MGNAPEKTKEERLKEGIEILRQLEGLGISKEDPGFIATKTLISGWVTDGKTVEEKIEFPRYGRRLEISLPRRTNRAAEAVFKTVRLGSRF